MIRVKLGFHDSTILNVFQIHQIVLLSCSRVVIRYIFHLLVSVYFTHWQYVTLEVTLYGIQLKSRIIYVHFFIFFRTGNKERSFINISLCLYTFYNHFTIIH